VVSREALIVGIALAALFALYRAAKRAITIADLKIANGKLTVVRGGIAPPILADLRDIARTPPISSLDIHIARASGRAEVTFRGDATDAQQQRIRNVIGSVPLARLVNAVRR
jgi:hypothetical protein